jgi:hypothetical protein
MQHRVLLPALPSLGPESHNRKLTATRCLHEGRTDLDEFCCRCRAFLKYRPATSSAHPKLLFLNTNWVKATGAGSSARFFRFASNSLFKIEFRVRSSTPIHRAVFGRPIFRGVQPFRFQLQFSHRWLAFCHFLGLPLRHRHPEEGHRSDSPTAGSRRTRLQRKAE